MTQFLIEAVLLTISGGLAGILLGGGIAFLMAGLADWAVKITPFSVFLAAGFSILIGLAFGIFPAHQASRLDPIEALRYE